jgi:hypothetical protein
LLPPRHGPAHADLLDRELAHEKASALGRLGRALEASLEAIATLDARHARGSTQSAELRQLRAALVAQASVALWHFVVQREACGLRDSHRVLRDYRVPPEVAARVGALPGRGARLRRTDRKQGPSISEVPPTQDGTARRGKRGGENAP